MNELKGGRGIAIIVVAVLAVLLFPAMESTAGVDGSSMDASNNAAVNGTRCHSVAGNDLGLDIESSTERWMHGGSGCDGAPGPC